MIAAMLVIMLLNEILIFAIAFWAAKEENNDKKDFCSTI